MKQSIPEKPSLEGLESKWGRHWESEGTYRFDGSKTREQIYSVDTPPPTVSGALHVGHAMSYTHTDLLVRYQRMRGKEIFYPMGWDDNGLPTERRVQNYFGVRCDPSLPYDPGFEPPADPPKPPISISRPNFIELCTRLTIEDEKVMEEVWRILGLSVDWNLTYTTIGEHSRRISQKSFLRLIEKGLAYQTEAPTLWDVDFQTAVAQAELEDREIPGAYHRVRFHGMGIDDIDIDTTRPELIPSCVALVAHPDDDRYKSLFGSVVATPLFGAEIPIKPHHLADPEKGTGIAMICTFGDLTDVIWWRELQLPVRSVLAPDGTFKQVTWGDEGWESLDPDRAQRYYNELTGLYTKKAQRRIVELLEESGDLIGEPKPITHPVKFYEKGDRPLEIITSRQWFIRVMPSQKDLIELGRQIQWHPDFMRIRYEDWINGLTGDWCISRQRYFGVSFPLWYRVDEEGNIDHDERLIPDESRLPIDPTTDVPEGFSQDQRDKPDGFTADPDVFDTWATSALTPEIAGHWDDDPDLFSRVFPMDLRPQAHDIIRTWLFVTATRSYFEHGKAPWKHATISGFVTDPDRKKMSKSKGNVVTPLDYLTEFGADAVRYWAAGGRLGYDTTEDRGQMKIGRRLSIKLMNASRFVLSQLGDEGEVTEALDKAMLAKLAKVIDRATASFDAYDYSKALNEIEPFFWTLCDDYLELVKSRAYGANGPQGAASANRSLNLALSAILRMFAPFLPYVTEEVWSWWQTGSIHRAEWPSSDELKPFIDGANGELLDIAAAVLGDVRKAKTERKLSLKAEVDAVTVSNRKEYLQLLELAGSDIKQAGSIQRLELTEGEPGLEVELAES